MARLANGLILALVLLLLLAVPAYAGSLREMEFDGVRITLGQPTDQALSRLHGTFDLQPVASRSGTYTISTKARFPKQLGLITFQNGQVVSLERERGSFQDYKQGQALATLVKELVKEDNNYAAISVERRLNAGTSQEVITLKFPGKRILITVTDADSGNGQVSFQEILE